jgi:hypothetical protein
VLGGLVYRRLREVLLPEFRRLWSRDVEKSAGALATRIEDLQAEVAQLRRGYLALLVADRDRRDAPLVDTLDARLSLDAIRAHVCTALGGASIVADPTPHMQIERVLPQDFYELLLRALPPAELFPDRDPIKQDFEIEALDDAPVLSQRVWRFFDEQVVGQIVVPALLERFRDPVTRRYAEMGGERFGAAAAAIPHRPFAGRIQLRRPGYHLRPHMDPKRVALTGLFYFARPGDSEAFGTELFRLDPPIVASGLKTFFPEDAGATCTPVRTVPFRANTLLVFVNGGAAHGATLPADAPLKERYSYQFYVKPDDSALKRRLAELPEEARAAWGGFV